MSRESTEESKNVILPSVDTIIKKIANENDYDDFELDVKALDSGGGNYTGDLFTIDVLQDGKETLHLFAKASNIPQAVRGQMPVKEIYAREIFTYTTLSEAFHVLQNNHRVPEERRFRLAKYYGSDSTEPHEVLVLENLAEKGYEVYDRRTSMDWEYARAALAELAKFHALSFALEIENPEMYDKLIRTKKEFTVNADIPAEGLKAYLDGQMKTVLEALEAEYVEPITKYCDSFLERWPKEFLPLNKQSVLVHGDYRISNIMVKYEDGQLKSLIPLDYQIIFHGSPINDIMYLLFTGSDEAFRREHYEDYIQQYYYELARALAALHHRVHDVYPRALYLQHVREKLLYGLGVAVFMLPIMMVEAADAPKIADMMEGMSGGDVGAPTIRGNALYAERLNGIAADMRRWGVLDALR